MNIPEQEIIRGVFEMLKIAAGTVIGLGLSTGDLKKVGFGAVIGIVVIFLKGL